MTQTNAHFLQKELERRIIHGLSCEWEAALMGLDEGEAHGMKKPLFRLSEMTTRLGIWHGEKREIRLNRSFVLNHSWDAVREVLVHEMAHQFVDEVYKVNHEPPHGRAFYQACRLLRANPEASGKYAPLHDRAGREANHADDKIMITIKKLMALAESRNTHEAESAMAKSLELIKKYNIDLIEQDKNKDFFSVFVGKPALRHFREEYCLALLLTDFYFVKGIWVPAYVLEKGKMGHVLEISGTARNIEISAYVYDYVKHFIDSQWRGYNRENQFSRYRKTDFAVGIIDGFRSKLEMQDKVSYGCQDRSLMMVKDPALEKYMHYRYPRVRSFSRRASSCDRNILTDGMDLGRKMVISKGITQESNRRIFLIENNES